MRVYTDDEWPHGLRCMICDTRFVEGQPISKKLVGMATHGDEPVIHTETVCVPCGMGLAADV